MNQLYLEIQMKQKQARIPKHWAPKVLEDTFEAVRLNITDIEQCPT